MDVAAKGWAAALKEGPAAALQSALFWLSVITNVIFLVGMRAGTIIGCHRCDVLLFIPTSTVMNIFVSVATGLAVLEEWKQVTSCEPPRSEEMINLSDVSEEEEGLSARTRPRQPPTKKNLFQSRACAFCN
eukprot:g22379.t1